MQATHISRDFCRTTWVSDHAHSEWGPKRQSINKAFVRTEVGSVAMGVRPAALMILNAEELGRLLQWCKPRLLNAVPIDKIAAEGAGIRARRPVGDEPFAYRVCVAGPHDIDAFVLAVQENQDERIGSLLGIPQCCRAFFNRVWNRDHKIDTTWAMAKNTSQKTSGAILKLQCDWRNNILLRWLGIRPVSYLPCSFDCAATRSMCDAFMSVMRHIGFSSEAEWIQEFLSWPTNWSALHGIAEIRNPVLKLSCNSDFTLERHEVCIDGQRYPERGARGLSHPFIPSTGASLTTNSAFRRGIDQVAKGMDKLHAKPAPTPIASRDTTTTSWRPLLVPDAWEPSCMKSLLQLAGRFGQASVSREFITNSGAAFDGRIMIALCSGGPLDSEYSFAPTHPNINKADEYLKLWPSVRAQFLDIVRLVCPLTERHQGPEDRILGSICGSNGISEVYSLVTNQVGFAEGLVHEMAHCKLRAIGIGLEHAFHIITNKEEALYKSPIRYDKLRPMSAIIHGQYSFLHVLELNRRIAVANPGTELARRIVAETIAAKVPRLQFGHSVIAANLAVSGDNEEFRDALLEWSAIVLKDSTHLLEENGIAPQPFQHPLE